MVSMPARITRHQLHSQANIVQQQAEALVSVPTRNGFPFRAAHGSILVGWAIVYRGTEQDVPEAKALVDEFW
jgi:hypothetical protein